MYVRYMITDVYKNTINSVEVSLIDNNHLRAAMMIQKFTSRGQCILYSAKGKDLNCVLDLLF